MSDGAAAAGAAQTTVAAVAPAASAAQVLDPDRQPAGAGVVAALDAITAAAADFEQTLARAALRDGQRGALKSQHAVLVATATAALQAAAEQSLRLQTQLRAAEDGRRGAALAHAASQRRLRADQEALQDRCGAILSSVAGLQKQFAAERDARLQAERAVVEESEARRVEVQGLREQLRGEYEDEAARQRQATAQALSDGRAALAAKQQTLVAQHRRYTKALVAKLEAEAAAKVHKLVQQETAAVADLRRAAQRELEDNTRYKAELLRLKTQYSAVSGRAQQLQRELFNCQQEQEHLARQERDRAVQQQKGSDALLRREVADLEQRLSGAEFAREREASSWRAKLELLEQAHAAQQARQEALVTSVRRHAEMERVELDTKHNEELKLVQARIRQVVSAKDAAIARLRAQVSDGRCAQHHLPLPPPQQQQVEEEGRQQK